MNYVYLKIPRFDGRKTLAFNGLVFIAASAAQVWLVAGGSAPALDAQTWLMLLGAVAALNVVLRLVTERPVWWRQWWHVGFDMAAEGADETVYHKAAAFAEPTLADMAEHEAARRILPYAEFSRDLDKALCRDVRAVTGIDDILPLDEDRERH